jgi:hypothetical protein
MIDDRLFVLSQEKYRAVGLIQSTGNTFLPSDDEPIRVINK